MRTLALVAGLTLVFGGGAALAQKGAEKGKAAAKAKGDAKGGAVTVELPRGVLSQQRWPAFEEALRKLLSELPEAP